MGKASDNERLNLRTTFFNNLGIGLLLTGLLVPYLSLFGRIGQAVDWVASDHSVTFSGAAQFVGTIAGMVSAFTGWANADARPIAWRARPKAEPFERGFDRPAYLDEWRRSG